MAASGVQEHNEAIRKERVLMRKAHIQQQQRVIHIISVTFFISYKAKKISAW